MEPYLPILLGIIGLIGGGLGVAVWNYFTGRRKGALEFTGLQDQQITQWRNDSLDMSSRLLVKDQELGGAQLLVHQHEITIQDLKNELADCLEHQENCNCNP